MRSIFDMESPSPPAALPKRARLLPRLPRTLIAAGILHNTAKEERGSPQCQRVRVFLAYHFSV
jgi:hypothetical protein